MLAIRCEFLQGTYQAAAPGRYLEPEWPPHPARLHAALLASAFATGRSGLDDEARDALEWLERQPPPTIAGSELPRQRTAPRVYVPRNLTPAETKDVLSRLARGDAATRQRGRVDRRFPAAVPGDEPVWIVWKADPGQHQRVLERLVRELQYLGSSRSPVCCDLVDDPPAPTFVPDGRPAAAALRVAIPGFTARLVEAASLGEFPPPTTGALVAYGRPAAMEARPAARGGPFAEVVTWELPRGFPLDAPHAATVARAFRTALLSRAGDEAPELLHGHGSHPHAAFLPLPAVGMRRASGVLVGVGLAVPARTTAAEREAILAAARNVDHLQIPQLGRYPLVLPDPLRALRSVDPARWIGPSREWTTATPLVVDRHPKRRTAEAVEAAIRETLRNALLEEPIELQASRVPWLAGAPHAGALRGDGLPAGMRTHVRMVFARPVFGPLLAGRGRYFGIGLFAPLWSEA